LKMTAGLGRFSGSGVNAAVRTGSARATDRGVYAASCPKNMGHRKTGGALVAALGGCGEWDGLKMTAGLGRFSGSGVNAAVRSGPVR
jgi:hypothetical protein